MIKDDLPGVEILFRNAHLSKTTDPRVRPTQEAGYENQNAIFSPDSLSYNYQ